MKRRAGWAIVLLVPLILPVLAVSFGCTTTHRSMSYTYPVTVEAPERAEVTSVAYRCLWNRSDADLILQDVGTDQFTLGFDEADGLTFDVTAPGHRTTRWGGLVEDRGRCSVLMVVAETTAGETLVGVVDLPEQEAPVRVALQPAP